MRPGSTTQQSSATSPPNESHDPAQDSRVLLERVGVERGHHAARPSVAHADHDATRTQAIARPAGLVEAGGTADHDVRAEAPAVDADGLRHARRQHRQRKHVVALTAVTALEAHELDARPGGSAHELARAGRVPRQALDGGSPSSPSDPWRPSSRGRKRDVTTRRIAVVRARVDRRRRRPAHVCDLEALAAQRLDRVAPELLHLQRHAGSLARSASHHSARLAKLEAFATNEGAPHVRHRAQLRAERPGRSASANTRTPSRV